MNLSMFRLIFCFSLFTMTISFPQALDTALDGQSSTVDSLSTEPKTGEELSDINEPQQVNATNIVPVEKIRIQNNVYQNNTERNKKRSLILEQNVISKLYKLVTDPLNAVLTAPKVNSVLKNIGTCMVNGMVELISFYFPAPLIPLIASAAGLVIPFEPVVMLRDKMPVTSYRRAFLTAVNTFMRSFNRFKIDDNYIDDPYMMQRFNRRMMSVGGSKEKVPNTDPDQDLEHEA